MESNSNASLFKRCIVDWIHDDITWCFESNCPVETCRRNPVNMINKNGLHSYAQFRGTAECSVSAGLNDCIDGCVHAKECFAQNDNPDLALKVLIEQHCDNCAFASMEED